MDVPSLLVFLCVLAALAGVVVWLFTRVQEHHRAHYAAMIDVAGNHGLKFKDDPNPEVRLHLDGVIDGIAIRILSRMSRQGADRGPRTEVLAAIKNVLPKQTTIELDLVTGRLVGRGEHGQSAGKLLDDRRIRHALEALAKATWDGVESKGWLDEQGAHITVSTLVNDPKMLSEILAKAVNTATALRAGSDSQKS